MKLAIITSRYPKENEPYNHMFVHVRSLYFSKAKVEVTVFVPSNKTETYLMDGITVICDSGSNISELLVNYDIVYLHLLNLYPIVKSGGYAIYKFLKKVKTPIIMYIHGSEVLKYPKFMYDFTFTITGVLKVLYKNLWHFPLIKSFIQLINKRDNVGFIFPSQWMRNITEKNLICKLKNTYIIPNGIDTNHFKGKIDFSKINKIVVLRPFETKKYAVDIAIDVMKHLPNHFTMEIFGKGRLQKYFEKKIKKEGLLLRVSIKNTFISRKNLPDFLSNYGIFMATTRCDAQGVSMCEAMASCLLTCSNPNTAIPEFIQDGKNGVLGETASEIAAKIISLSEDKDKFERIVKEGRKSMENIAIELVGKKELNVLQDYVNK